MADQMTYILEHGLQGFASLVDVILGFRVLVYESFGMPGVYAFYIASAALAVLVITKLLKMALVVAKYLVIPSVALALLATWLFGVSFAASLPVCVVGCSVVMLVKS